MSQVIIAGDTSGTITLQAPAVSGSTTLTLPAVTGTVLQSGTVVTEAQGGNGTTTGYYGFKNRIINGAMVIDQRNAGVVSTPVNDGYMLDRWKYNSSQASKFTVQQNAGAVTTLAGFPNYMGFTVSSAVTVGASDNFMFSQRIEGFNFADLAWGTASAATVTLSFKVYSSLTGTFGGSLQNSAENRSYPFTYSISSANTWTTISVTVAGDTSGTWIGATSGVGLKVWFSLGMGSTYSGTAGAWAGATYFSATGAVSVVGTSGATFYITGVQLEKGSTATSFDYRPYRTELALCQRYFQTWGGTTGNEYAPWTGLGYNSTTAEGCFIFICPMRSAPSLTQVGNWVFNDAASDNAAGTLGIGTTGLQTTQMRSSSATGITQYRPYTLRASSTSSRIQLSAEL